MTEGAPDVRAYRRLRARGHAPSCSPDACPSRCEHERRERMSENRELLDRYVERYNAGDLDGVIELYADDSVQGMPDGVFEGRSSDPRASRRELEAIPDVTHTVRRASSSRATRSPTSGRSSARTRVLRACRTAACSRPPASGWRSEGWRSCALGQAGRSSSTPCTTTTSPSLPTWVSSPEVPTATRPRQPCSRSPADPVGDFLTRRNSQAMTCSPSTDVNEAATFP